MEYKEIDIIIDKGVLAEYNEYYFSIHKKAKKEPISKPYHESINTWMILRRPAMNALKQRWKNFINWLVIKQGYDNLHIERCEINQTIYYPNNLRHDVDNSVPKFILDGLVESGMVIDDSSKHIYKLTLQCDVDVENPRTELKIIISENELKEINYGE